MLNSIPFLSSSLSSSKRLKPALKKRLVDLINPQILGSFIDTAASNTHTIGTLILTAIVFLVSVVLRQVVVVAEGYAATNVQFRATNKMRRDLLAHCLSLDLTFYHEHRPGELIERIDGDISTLGNFFSRFVVSLVGNALLLLCILGLFFAIDWRLGLALTLFSILSVYATRYLQKSMAPIWTMVRQVSTDLSGFLEEYLSGMEDIRSSGAGSYVMRELAIVSRPVLTAWRKARTRVVAIFNIIGTLFTLGTMLALGIALWLYTTGRISAGIVYVIYSYAQLLSRPLNEFHSQVQDFQQAFASIKRIRELFALRSAIENTGTASLPEQAFSVEFHDVSFAYTPEQPVLKSLSFSLPAGQVMGILGRTGSGKTTMTRLLERFYDPQSGSILLGGVDIRQLRTEDLRKRVAMITQDVHLFHASLRDNLTLFDDTIPDERILSTIKLLGIDTWYNTLAEGLDTQLAPEGNGLSTGEAQLLAFTRIFLQEPDLVILDEASSRLDPITEQRIERGLDHLLAGRTGIIIAHRLATVQRADKILIIEQGTCAEYGDRQTLVAHAQSRFSQLLRTGLQETQEVIL